MERNKLYTVTKASSDDVIRLGDLIWLSEDDTLNSIMYMGTCLRKNWDVPARKGKSKNDGLYKKYDQFFGRRYFRYI